MIHNQCDLKAVINKQGSTEAASWDVPADDWHVPDGATLNSAEPGFDIAVKVFNPKIDGESANVADFAALSTDDRVPDCLSVELGRPIYYAGLLKLPAQSRPSLAPVVRGGTLAAADEAQVIWKDDDKFHWTAPSVDLIDVRSRTGFSGAPAFVQFYVAGASKGASWPGEWDTKAEEAGKSASEIAALTMVESYTHWLGMLAGFLDESGIGAIIRSCDILDFLHSDELSAGIGQTPSSVEGSSSDA